MRVVRGSFLLSGVYNVVGLTIAAAARLEPVVCAILMPLSSVTVVAFAVGLTRWAARVLPAASHPDGVTTRSGYRPTTEDRRT